MSEHDEGPEEIFLQPSCCASPDTGRMWCEHDAPENCEDGAPWTRYVRADIHAALIAEVRRDEREKCAQLAAEREEMFDDCGKISEAVGCHVVKCCIRAKNSQSEALEK